MRRLLVLPLVVIGLAGCVAVSGQPAPRPVTTTIVAPAPVAPTAVIVPGPTALTAAPVYAPVVVRP